VMDRLAAMRTVRPSTVLFRTFMRFETADPAAAWLNRSWPSAAARVRDRAVRIEVFDVL